MYIQAGTIRCSGVARVMLIVGMPGRYIQCDNWCLPPVGIHTYNYTRTDNARVCPRARMARPVYTFDVNEVGLVGPI